MNQKVRCVYYLALALYLAAPQLPGLWRLLVRQQPAAPVREPAVPGPRAWRVALGLVPLGFAVLLAVHFLPSNWHRYRTAYQQDLRRGPNYGVWRVERFDVADPAGPLWTDTLSAEMELAPGQERWQRLILDAADTVYIQAGNGLYDNVDAKEDPQTGETTFSDSGDARWQCRLRFQRPTPTTLTAQGTVNGNAVTASFTLESTRESHLADMPHWVSVGRRW